MTSQSWWAYITTNRSTSSPLWHGNRHIIMSWNSRKTWMRGKNIMTSRKRFHFPAVGKLFYFQCIWPIIFPMLKVSSWLNISLVILHDASSHGNASHGGFPSQRVSNAELWCLLLLTWTICKTNSWVASDLKGHDLNRHQWNAEFENAIALRSRQKVTVLQMLFSNGFTGMEVLYFGPNFTKICSQRFIKLTINSAAENAKSWLA